MQLVPVLWTDSMMLLFLYASDVEWRLKVSRRQSSTLDESANIPHRQNCHNKNGHTTYDRLLILNDPYQTPTILVQITRLYHLKILVEKQDI